MSVLSRRRISDAKKAQKAPAPKTEEKPLELGKPKRPAKKAK